MRPFVKNFAAGALLISLSSADASEKGKSSDKGTKKDKKAKSAFNADTVPIPTGHSAEGVVLPYFDEHGKLQMNFKIKSATRVDDEHLQMADAEMETFDEEGKTEMKIDMPNSMLDLNTHVVTSQTPVTIRRSDFEVTGETMRFNTNTRNGVMIGKIRMLIFNHDEMSKENKNE